MPTAIPKTNTESPRPRSKAAAANRSGGIQSIARACQLLEEVARTNDGIALAELSRRLGLHTSTAFHIARTLVNLGYLRQDEQNRSYRIGRMLFTLAAAALDEAELVRVAAPVLAELATATGETTYLAVNSSDQLVVIAKHEGAGPIRITDSLGSIRPKHATALGKVMLAALTPEQLDAFLRDHELPGFTPKTITSPERLRREVDEVRRNGVAFDDGELNEELRCVAVPVRDYTGRVSATIGVSGPAWRLSLQALQRQLGTIRSAADRLSTELGYRRRLAATP
jgi:IclR family transcriptional regulator, KDG regulon repressor